MICLSIGHNAANDIRKCARFGSANRAKSADQAPAPRRLAGQPLVLGQHLDGFLDPLLAGLVGLGAVYPVEILLPVGRAQSRRSYRRRRRWLPAPLPAPAASPDSRPGPARPNGRPSAPRAPTAMPELGHLSLLDHPDARGPCCSQTRRCSSSGACSAACSARRRSH